ncbi:MAG TPA: hypothetical protein VKE40_06020 [Gemmataceae bacterium]|nr:hypothetical protein [Gemmataceae bacterium]
MSESRCPPRPRLLVQLRANPHRIEAVETILAECEPDETTGAELFGGGVCWLLIVAGDDEAPHLRACLPPALFDQLPVGESDDPDSAVRYYATPNAAYRALWEACESYAGGPKGKP